MAISAAVGSEEERRSQKQRLPQSVRRGLKARLDKQQVEGTPDLAGVGDEFGMTAVLVLRRGPATCGGPLDRGDGTRWAARGVGLATQWTQPGSRDRRPDGRRAAAPTRSVGASALTWLPFAAELPLDRPT